MTKPQQLSVWTTSFSPQMKPRPMNERSIEESGSRSPLDESLPAAIKVSDLDDMTELEVSPVPGSENVVQTNTHLSQQLVGKSPRYFPAAPSLSLSSPQQLLATVEQPGYIRLRLTHGIVLSIASNLTVRLESQASSVCVSRDGRLASIVHPTGQAQLQCGSIEVQCRDSVSVKKAKVRPLYNVNRIITLPVPGEFSWRQFHPQQVSSLLPVWRGEDEGGQ